MHRRAHLSDLGNSYKNVKCGDEQTVTVSRDKKGESSQFVLLSCGNYTYSSI